MITFQDKDGRYRLPTGWHEVPTAQYLELDRQQLRTVEARASFFAGRPIQVNGLVADALAWALRPLPPDGGLAYPSDLGAETFQQVEAIRTLLLAQPLNACFAEVYATFKNRHDNWGAVHFDAGRVPTLAARCLTWPITDTYPAVAHCLAELKRLDEAFAVLAEPDDTEAGQRAKDAGSDALLPFGQLNIALAFSKGVGVSLDGAYQTPWSTVMVWLVRERILAQVQDRLQHPSGPSPKGD